MTPVAKLGFAHHIGMLRPGVRAMPTYPYLCDHCGIVEVLQSARDPAAELCPECGSRDFHRSHLSRERVEALWKDVPLAPVKPTDAKPTPPVDPAIPAPQPKPLRKPE
jgi:putative FmdB family regulatory protein